MMKIKKGIPLIDQHDKNGYWGEKFGGNFIPETLKKPVEDLTILFEKLRRDKRFIKKSENTIIPGNFNLTKKEKTYRAKKYCIPYRNKIENIIKSRMKKKIIPIIISIHSFTPVYNGKSRPWHLGLLFRKEKRVFSLLIKELQKDKSIKTGINQPYKCNLKGDFSIPYFAEMNGLPCILLEIRQDLINSKSGVIKWSKKILKLINKIILHKNIEFSVRRHQDVLLYYNKKNKI